MGNQLRNMSIIQPGSKSPRRQIRLPSEVWLDVLQFLSFAPLHKRIRFVGRRFAALVEPLAMRVGTRIARRIYMSDDWTGKIARFVMVSHSSVVMGKKFTYPYPKQVPLPTTPVPSNIVGFRDISLGGLIDQELLTFMANCRVKIDKCLFIIASVDGLMKKLDKTNVPMDTFFAALPQKCVICFLRKFSSNREQVAKLLDCPFVRDSVRLDIQLRNEEFDSETLLRWLHNSCPDQRIKGLYISRSFLGRHGRRLNEQLSQMVRTIVDRHAQGTWLNDRFELVLYNFELTLEPFDGETLVLQRFDNNKSWELFSTWFEGQEEIQQQMDEQDIKKIFMSIR